MSAQFGKCNFDGKPIDPKDLDEVRPVLAPYGPDGEGYICKDNFGILYRAFHTTKESRRETQPHISESGLIIGWEGRLDNREELIGQLAGLSLDPTDLEIVAAGYQRLGVGAFRRLIGDWALSIWDPKDQSLVLAKDFVGTRHLYYSVEKDQVTWCTILDPLVLFGGRSFKLEEEYIAGWLSFFPAPHLTPYIGIHAVPPSSFVQLTRNSQKVCKYWDFNPSKRIRYRTNAEYEEHFRVVFSESVRRRLRSDSPILAELSGGMDSSSIVCMADDIISRGLSEAPRLDTLSYYDDTEPNWNERPYFARVEQKRGRVGFHIDVGSQKVCLPQFAGGLTPVTPNLSFRSTETNEQFLRCVQSHGNRILLSGIGGDEVTGGVPTPMPEIEDLLAQVRLTALVTQLKSWALNQRKPWFHLLFAAGRRFLPPHVAGRPKRILQAEWLQQDFARKHFVPLTGYPSRLRFFGPMPSFQENISTLEALRRQLACSDLSCSCPEKRYPYLDRDLIEFLFAVPREQLVRPGQRRSLMRRALKGIVPDEILNRKRKAFVARSPMTGIASQSSVLTTIACRMVSEAIGIVDAGAFCKTVQEVCRGNEVPIIPLMRTVAVEFWLRAMRDHEFFSARLSVASFSRPANGVTNTPICDREFS